MKSYPRQPSPRHSPTSVLEFLQRDDGAAGLLPAAQRMLKLREDLLALMPAKLGENCEVSGFDDETVVLRVSSAGAAAKLRQTLPRLRDGLLHRGWKVNAIKMRVQPLGSSTVSTTWRASSQTAIPQDGVDAFAALHSQLEDSPLKSAVERLLRRRPRA
ncbi:MAG: DciA family protein [Burkholderiaceae bacterium]